MRLTKDNLNIKKEKKKVNKNKSLIQEKPNIKYKIENPYLQEKIKKFNNDLIKERQKEKNLKDLNRGKQFQSNTNIYKNNKKIQNKNNSQLGKDFERTSIYTKNKTISLNSNNNINIGNNINIITNNHIHEANLPNKENKFQTNLINNRGILTDFNLPKKSQTDIYNNNINNINNLINKNNDDNERMNRIKEATGNQNRKFKGKNTSMEHRYRRYNKEIIMSDGDLMSDEEENIDIRKNHIYSHPYKYKSPSELYNNTFKSQNNNLDRQNNILNNHYFYNRDYDNLDEGGEAFYNNYYKLKYVKKSFNTNNRNKYNSVIKSNGQNKYNYDFQSKTSNSFYAHKSPVNTHNNLNNNLITNRDYSKDIDDEYGENIYTSYMDYMNNKKENEKELKYKGRYHSMIEDVDLPLSPYRNYANTNINNDNNRDEFKSIRRSKNQIKIIKKNNNTSIQEYNLSLGDNYIDNYQNKYEIVNDRDGFSSINYNEKTDLKQYFNHFSKNIQPMSNSQLNIKSIFPKTNLTTNNSNNKKNNINTSSNKKNNLINNEIPPGNSKSTNNIISTPNFSDTGKTPKRPNNLINQNIKIKPFNSNDINNENNISNSINNSNNDDNNSQYKIMVKKRPKNDIPVPLGGVKRRSSSSISINKNINKMTNNNFEICSNDKINYISNIQKEKNDENKFIFDSENDIIDYIFNKFEEERKKKSYFNRKLRFTGFILSKKFKGKNLYDIRIEDDLDKINQQLKDEQVVINDKLVEFKFLDEEKDNNKENNKNNVDINNNELIEENKQLKIEKEKMNKKDNVKNELIKKLDREKQNCMEEIEKLKNEIEKLKKENNKYKLINTNENNNKLEENNLNTNSNNNIDNEMNLLNQKIYEENTLENKEIRENENTMEKKEKKLAFLLDKIMNKNNTEGINSKNSKAKNNIEENKEKIILKKLDNENKVSYENNAELEQKENIDVNDIMDNQISNKEEVN